MLYIAHESNERLHPLKANNVPNVQIVQVPRATRIVMRGIKNVHYCLSTIEEEMIIP